MNAEIAFLIKSLEIFGPTKSTFINSASLSSVLISDFILSAILKLISLSLIFCNLITKLCSDF